MALQRNDIINKVFSRSYLGYNDEEVDAFLDLIMDDIDAYVQEILSQKQENDQLKQQNKLLNEEVSRAAISRQEIFQLKEENHKLRDEIAGIRSLFEQEKIDREKAQNDVRTMIDMAQAQAREIVLKAQSKADSLLKVAEDEGQKVASLIQERERKIIDRAQQRAREIINKAANITEPDSKFEEDEKSFNDEANTENQPEISENAKHYSNDLDLAMSETSDLTPNERVGYALKQSTGEKAKRRSEIDKEKPWLNWLDEND